MATRESAASAASATLATTAASWRDRSRSWLPLGDSPIPHAELDAFLSDARRTLHRANKAEVLDVFPAWSECIRALADNPLVLLHGEAAATLISTAIDLLSGKLSPSAAAGRFFITPPAAAAAGRLRAESANSQAITLPHKLTKIPTPRSSFIMETIVRGHAIG